MDKSYLLSINIDNKIAANCYDGSLFILKSRISIQSTTPLLRGSAVDIISVKEITAGLVINVSPSQSDTATSVLKILATKVPVSDQREYSWISDKTCKVLNIVTADNNGNRMYLFLVAIDNNSSARLTGTEKTTREKLQFIVSSKVE